jgi:uncharacterized membrane protein
LDSDDDVDVVKTLEMHHEDAKRVSLILKRELAASRSLPKSSTGNRTDLAKKYVKGLSYHKMIWIIVTAFVTLIQLCFVILNVIGLSSGTGILGSLSPTMSAAQGWGCLYIALAVAYGVLLGVIIFIQNSGVVEKLKDAEEYIIQIYGHFSIAFITNMLCAIMMFDSYGKRTSAPLSSISSYHTAQTLSITFTARAALGVFTIVGLMKISDKINDNKNDVGEKQEKTSEMVQATAEAAAASLMTHVQEQDKAKAAASVLFT